MLRRFNNEGCPALKGKPKFFILQACRGDECDFGSIIPTLETQESTICAVDAQGFSFDSLKTTISKDPTWEDMVHLSLILRAGHTQLNINGHGIFFHHGRWPKFWKGGSIFSRVFCEGVESNFSAKTGGKGVGKKNLLKNH